MAQNTLTALDAVSNLGGSKRGTDITKQYKEVQDRLLQISKKRIKDEAKAREDAEVKFQNYLKQQNKKTLEDKLKNLELEYQTAQTKQEKIAALTKKTISKIFGRNESVSLGEALSDAAVNAVKNITSGFSKGISDYLGAYSNYMSGIETRLQGSAKSFSSITSTISGAVGSSQYVKQSAILQNLSKLVEQGITYNVEQRAFLATVSDKIATTFDAFNSNLSQIIKIQQADSTAARLGLESQLTKFFNSTFGDTSYLSQMFDTVSASLLGAESQLGTKKSVEFEYTVQKWLGSLSAVGISDSTIQQLAQGLNYLGTGDITSLSNNQSLQNLLVMAANKSGLDYASMLTGGISSQQANQLLQGVVKFGQQIASNNNQVVKAQYANLFGLTISDMTSLLNLSSQDLVSISENMLSYSNMIAETNNQIASISSRMTIKDRIDTMFDNIMSSVGENIANSAAGYTTWIMADLVEKATGGIAIPTISVLGNSVDLNTTVTGLIKTGIVGISTLSEIGNILAGLTGANNLSLTNWGAAATTGRGTGFTGLTTTGVSTTTSESIYVGSSGSDIYEASVASAKETAQETVKGEEENETMQILRDSIATDLKSILSILSGWDNNIGLYGLVPGQQR